MDESTRAKRYHRTGRILSVAGFAIDLGLLALLMLSGWSITLRAFAERTVHSPALSLLLFKIGRAHV